MRDQHGRATRTKSRCDGNGDLADTFGGRIVRAREAQNLTTSQLARRLGVKTSTLRAWETDRSEPRSSRLTMLAGLLNVAPTWLLTGRGESPSDELSQTEMMQVREKLDRLREHALMLADELHRLNDRLETYQSYQD